MKRTAVIVLALMLMGLSWLIADFVMMRGRINLLWNYNYSSSVVRGVILEKNYQSFGENCTIPYAKIKVIESFKGKVQSTQTFKAIGIQAHEYDNVGSEHFLLLKDFVATEYPGLGDCNNNDLKDYLVIHNWCCAIEGKKWKSFVMYDMVYFEQKGDNYLHLAWPTLLYLRMLNLFQWHFAGNQTSDHRARVLPPLGR